MKTSISKKTLLDFQCRIMKVNVLIMGIEEKGHSESKYIKLQIAHMFGKFKEGKPISLVVRLTSFKCKEQVLGLSKKLKGTQFYLSNQYPVWSGWGTAQAYPNYEQSGDKTFVWWWLNCLWTVNVTEEEKITDRSTMSKKWRGPIMSPSSTWLSPR